MGKGLKNLDSPYNFVLIVYFDPFKSLQICPCLEIPHGLGDLLNKSGTMRNKLFNHGTWLI